MPVTKLVKSEEIEENDNSFEEDLAEDAESIHSNGEEDQILSFTNNFKSENMAEHAKSFEEHVLELEETESVYSNEPQRKIYPMHVTKFVKAEKIVEVDHSFEEQVLELEESELVQSNEEHSQLYAMPLANNLKSEKIVEDHQAEIERINRLPIAKNFNGHFKIENQPNTTFRRILPKPLLSDEKFFSNNPTFLTPQPMVKISLNKPSLNEPLVVHPPSDRHYYYKPRAPSNLVVNQLYPSPFPIRKDCCHQCKIIFNHTLDFLLHKYKKHPKTDRIPRSKYKYCSKCFKTFRSKKAFLNHKFVCTMRIHNYFECSGCSQGFNDYQLLKSHLKYCPVPLMVRHHRNLEKRAFACDMCNKRFSRKGGLTQHKNSFHFNIKPFVCRVCGHKYALKGDLARCRHKRALMNGFVQN